MKEIYMHRCLDLAKKGLGSVSPNPLVGSVIIYEDKIIGEGWHQQYGQAHAEVNAINSVQNKDLLPKSTIYVSLEPCAHFGKTPPCVNLIVKHKIPIVVIGCSDPFEAVNGKGIDKLKKAGIEVIQNVLKEECLALNKRFFTFHQKKRPYIILKWAQTQDGFMDKKREPNQKGSNWISGKHAKIRVHQWRTEEDAILVGSQTALNDNPSLTAREFSGKNPKRILIDRNLKVPSNFKLYTEEVDTIVFSRKTMDHPSHIQFQTWQENESLVTQVLKYSYEKNIQSIIIEGGAFTLQEFIDSNNWDEARVFIGPINFKQGLKAPSLHSSHLLKEKVGNDQLLSYFNL